MARPKNSGSIKTRIQDGGLKTRLNQNEESDSRTIHSPLPSSKANHFKLSFKKSSHGTPLAHWSDMPSLPRYAILDHHSTFHVTWQCHNRDWLLESDSAKQVYYNLLLKYEIVPPS